MIICTKHEICKKYIYMSLSRCDLEESKADKEQLQYKGISM